MECPRLLQNSQFPVDIAACAPCTMVDGSLSSGSNATRYVVSSSYDMTIIAGVFNAPSAKGYLLKSIEGKNAGRSAVSLSRSASNSNSSVRYGVWPMVRGETPSPSSSGAGSRAGAYSSLVKFGGKRGTDCCGSITFYCDMSVSAVWTFAARGRGSFISGGTGSSATRGCGSSRGGQLVASGFKIVRPRSVGPHRIRSSSIQVKRKSCPGVATGVNCGGATIGGSRSTTGGSGVGISCSHECEEAAKHEMLWYSWLKWRIEGGAETHGPTVRQKDPGTG
ncbi:hypothetical protein SARC_13970 [Sphaeroforma arctica JP610]|uniref:Uncharacterized protein n=1 Tax=Sphaeroforma arctica JP610 TaxID=667725 RepID=A0A0L0F9R5_9EUKA|nr:hypothetical protein SARC_13970 [Sphaeroforma arctica JP610]KNC73472.1 hypothetical protein SARC_13970 [Sphaeroforma arctica JP610]|eukprot:XP_014147374.1 hypothetical protein SARC_13970 [Sphaeroforma arctica JP610]